jgi:hypothetical protein
MRVTGAPVSTSPPCACSRRTSASGNAPDPPTGVAQPWRSRPDVMANGSAPVPARSGGWMVAKASHSMNERTTGCSNRSSTTSCALRRRSAS